MNAKYGIKYKYRINIDITQFKMPHSTQRKNDPVSRTAFAVRNMIFIQS